MVMNKLHPIKDGKLTKRTQNPLNMSRPATAADDQPLRDRAIFKIKEYQPEVSIGAKSLLQRIDKPSFSEKCR